MRPAVAGILLTCVAWWNRSVWAVNIPFQKVHDGSLRVQRSDLAVSISDGNATVGFTNVDNNVYVAQIFVQGQNFTVQLDTGSSDFWVDSSLAPGTPLEDTTGTGLNATSCYLDTTCASGPIILADVTFGNFSVQGQALVNAIDSNATYSDITSGLLGLGAPFASSSSIIQATSANTSLNSLPLLNNIMTSYPDVDNYITFQLSRTVSGDIAGGIFTIGETAEEWSSIQESEQLPVLLDNNWAAAIDGVVVNGHKLNATGSALPGSTQLLALFDTGTARALAPKDFVDAIYRDLPGAEFDGCCQCTLPCDTKINVSVLVGTRLFPLHPIDVVIVPEPGEESRADSDDTICISAFSYLGGNTIDMILGDTFLRNVYALYNYGAWTRADDGSPYIQLVSTTNASEAWLEFDALNDARLAARKQEPVSGKTSGGGRRFPVTVAGLLLWMLLGLALTNVF